MDERRLFEAVLINGQQGDPAVIITRKQWSEALLLDLGALEKLAPRDLLKVRTVLVSHAHMDHFIGFDQLLRLNVPLGRVLNIVGPRDIAMRVRAKLNSYTWNLIGADQLRFEVYEVHENGQIWRASLTNTDGFNGTIKKCNAEEANLPTLKDGTKLSAVSLDHRGIQSISYKIQAPDTCKVRMSQIKTLGLNSGPWISKLQDMLSQGKSDDWIDVDGKSFSVRELAQKCLDRITGPSLIYLTDVVFSRSNLLNLKAAFGSATQAIIETSFADRDRARAVAKAHLTSRQAALIAANLKVEVFTTFHVSSIYGQGPAEVVEEANAYFNSFCGNTPNLEHELEQEFIRSESQ